VFQNWLLTSLLIFCVSWWYFSYKDWNDPSFVCQFQRALLSNKFSLKNLGTPSYFLSVESVPTNCGMFLSCCYIQDLLKPINMHDSKPVSTPILVPTSKSNIIKLIITNFILQKIFEQFFSTLLQIAFDISQLRIYLQSLRKWRMVRWLLLNLLPK
jgi:hypothetical protein